MPGALATDPPQEPRDFVDPSQESSLQPAYRSVTEGSEAVVESVYPANEREAKAFSGFADEDI
jgi:hypothetical protein